jgi:hypothetical protein
MELPAIVTYADRLAKSNLLPKQYHRQPANVMYAMEYARALNLAPIAAITGIHVIEGKPTASAALIGALVRKAGHTLRVRMENGTAIAELVRKDDPDYTFRSEWTMDRAKKAGLTGKKVWQQYPDSMLKARAITEVARDGAEEVLFGLHYTPEELGAETDQDGNPTGDTWTVVRDDVLSATPEPMPQEDQDAWVEKAEQCETADCCVSVYRQAKAAGAPDECLEQIKAVGLTLRQHEREETTEHAASTEAAETARTGDATEETTESLLPAQWPTVARIRQGDPT